MDFFVGVNQHNVSRFRMVIVDFGRKLVEMIMKFCMQNHGFENDEFDNTNE